MQGCLDIPCILIFEGDAKFMSKAKKLSYRFAVEKKSAQDQNSTPSKKRTNNDLEPDSKAWDY